MCLSELRPDPGVKLPSVRDRRAQAGLSPRVACKNKWARIEALQRNKAFIEQYRDARIAKLAGQDVVFPVWTWWLHRFAGVKRAEPEATAPPV
jgi:hypothetical protein